MTRPLPPNSTVLQARLDAVFGSGWLTNNGPMVLELEAALARTLAVRDCKVFCNGTVALQVALQALELSGEVLTTPFTFPATVHAIAWNGLDPVFCDIDPATYGLDPAHAASLVGSATSALLPVHVFGNPCDDERLSKLAADRGLRVVYDAAHAFGVTRGGESVCGWGDLSVLSFHATKLFHTCEGGAVVTSDAELSKKVALLRNFGIESETEVHGLGLNGKLSEVHAAVGLTVLDSVEAEIGARRELHRRYVHGLMDVTGLRVQEWSPRCQDNYSHFTIEVDEEGFGMTRDTLHHALRAEGIVVRRYYSPLCSENEIYRGLESARPENLPNAHRLARSILCLPLHGGLSGDDVDLIVDRIVAVQAHAPRVIEALSGL